MLLWLCLGCEGDFHIISESDFPNAGCRVAGCNVHNILFWFFINKIEWKIIKMRKCGWWHLFCCHENWNVLLESSESSYSVVNNIHKKSVWLIKSVHAPRTLERCRAIIKIENSSHLSWWRIFLGGTLHQKFDWSFIMWIFSFCTFLKSFKKFSILENKQILPNVNFFSSPHHTRGISDFAAFLLSLHDLLCFCCCGVWNNSSTDAMR